MAGDLLALSVSLAPCTIGYAEIGARLEPRLAEHGGTGEHPYRGWIGEYAGEEFTAASRAATVQLDELAADGRSERRLDELTEVFRTATRLETDFWQQGLDSADGVVRSSAAAGGAPGPGRRARRRAPRARCAASRG